MRPYCGRECPSGPMTWMLCQPVHAISSARRSSSPTRHVSRVASLHDRRPGRERVAVPVASEHGHELVERRGRGRLAALDARGRGLVLLCGVGDGGRAAAADAPHPGAPVRGVGVEAADGHGAGESVRRELAGHGKQGQRDRQFERARVLAGGQGRVSGAGGLEAHVGADGAHVEVLQGVGDGRGRLLRHGVADVGDMESSGRVGGGGHREQVSLDAACVRAVDLHFGFLGGADRVGGAICRCCRKGLVGVSAGNMARRLDLPEPHRVETSVDARPGPPACWAVAARLSWVGERGGRTRDTGPRPACRGRWGGVGVVPGRSTGRAGRQGCRRVVSRARTRWPARSGAAGWVRRSVTDRRRPPGRRSVRPGSRSTGRGRRRPGSGRSPWVRR